MNADRDMLRLAAAPPPRKLMRALQTIARDLHPTFEAEPWIRPGASFESCVLCSLAARDFLRGVGFASAEVAPVMLTIRAFDQSGAQVHSLGAGVPDTLPDTDLRWNGHMVTTVGGWLIDCTLQRMNRPQWPWLPGSVIAPLWSKPTMLHGHSVMAGDMVENDGLAVAIAWQATPQNERWRLGPDAYDERRRNVVATLVDAFKK